MNRRLGQTHLDALDTMSADGRPWLYAQEIASDVGRGARETRRTLRRLVRDLAVEVDKTSKAHRYRITGRGRVLLTRNTDAGDFPARRV